MYKKSMEAACGTALQSFTYIGPTIKLGRKSSRLVGFNHRCIEEYSLQVVNLSESLWKGDFARQRQFDFIISHSCKKSQAHAPGSENLYASFDVKRILKNKAENVASQLNGRCIFLVGMMGSGKTTVGKILSDALGYSFVDSDNYVEQEVGGTSVAQIFKQCGERFFRDTESEALRKLSMSPQLVVATGGGAVVRPINWKYMRRGVSVFLEAPLDALARRIASVGTDSRPLLHSESGDAYTTAFVGLFTLSKKRSEKYANADATVSLQYIAAKACLEDVLDITPTAVAIEVLEQIENFLSRNGESTFL